MGTSQLSHGRQQKLNNRRQSRAGSYMRFHPEAVDGSCIMGQTRHFRFSGERERARTDGPKKQQPGTTNICKLLYKKSSSTHTHSRTQTCKQANTNKKQILSMKYDSVHCDCCFVTWVGIYYMIMLHNLQASFTPHYALREQGTSEFMIIISTIVVHRSRMETKQV